MPQFSHPLVHVAQRQGSGNALVDPWFLLPYPCPMGIREGIEAARARIEAALQACGRIDTVHLQLAVKTRSAEQCREAAATLADLGLPILLGHNRVQEARATAEAIREVPGARIHLIGPLQTNKINMALSCVDAIDTVDRADLARRLDARATALLPVLVQVNVSGEASKSGCMPAEVPALVEDVLACENLRFDGLMTVGLNSVDEVLVRRGYALLRELRENLCSRFAIAEGDLALSMGMSHDLEWAIAEGATTVRLGTAIFGQRDQHAAGASLGDTGE